MGAPQKLLPLRFFGQKREGENPLKKTAIFGQKTPILALFDPFFEENFRQFSVKGGGYPPFQLRVFGKMISLIDNDKIIKI